MTVLWFGETRCATNANAGCSLCPPKASRQILSFVFPSPGKSLLLCVRVFVSPRNEISTNETRGTTIRTSPKQRLRRINAADLLVSKQSDTWKSINAFSRNSNNGSIRSSNSDESLYCPSVHFVISRSIVPYSREERWWQPLHTSTRRKGPQYAYSFHVD